MKGDAHPFGASELGHSCERSQQGHARGPGPTVYRTHLFSIGEADSVNSNVDPVEEKGQSFPQSSGYMGKGVELKANRRLRLRSRLFPLSSIA